jgi:hypothetical protein
MAQLAESLPFAPDVGPRFIITRSSGGAGRITFARFAATVGVVPGPEWEYVTVLGSRLLDVAVPAVVGEPAGILLDVGSERPMMFPPMAGIVPDEAALDACAEDRHADDNGKPATGRKRGERRCGRLRGVPDSAGPGGQGHRRDDRRAREAGPGAAGRGRQLIGCG